VFGTTFGPWASLSVVAATVPRRSRWHPRVHDHAGPSDRAPLVAGQSDSVRVDAGQPGNPPTGGYGASAAAGNATPVNAPTGLTILATAASLVLDWNDQPDAVEFRGAPVSRRRPVPADRDGRSRALT
jgi:hypothetical protein